MVCPVTFLILLVKLFVSATKDTMDKSVPILQMHCWSNKVSLSLTHKTAILTLLLLLLATRFGLINGISSLAAAGDVDAITLVSLTTNLASLTSNIDELSNSSAAAATAVAMSILRSANDINAAYTGIIITYPYHIIIITILIVRFITVVNSN